MPTSLSLNFHSNSCSHPLCFTISLSHTLSLSLSLSLSLLPRDPFTIKITGGPDCDVAGNLIRILFRDYGTNCKVVGIADGFGVAEDPNGLDSEELLRLVKESLPITSFKKVSFN